MKKMKWIVLMVLAILMLPVLVLAETAGVPVADTVNTVVNAAKDTEMAGWMKLLWEVITVLLGIVSAVAVPLVTAAIYKYFGIKLEADNTQMLRDLANQAVHYAEQRAKAGAIDKSTRAQVALDFMIKSVAGSKLPNIAAERLTWMIEAELGLQNSLNGKTIKNSPTPPADNS